MASRADGTGEKGGRRGDLHLNILEDHLTLFQPEGEDYAHQIFTYLPPDYDIFRLLRGFISCLNFLLKMLIKSDNNYN